MPLIDEARASAIGNRSSRVLWLLLLPPLILLSVLGAATVQPIELGPIVIVSEFNHGARKGFSVGIEPFPESILGGISYNGRHYGCREDGVAWVTDLHFVGHSLGWFWGRRITF